MAYKQGDTREQLTIEPLCLDDYIEEGNICRIIDLFVKSLDMVALGFKYAETKATGRRPYNPVTMMMLYLYGYLNRIRSSRRLETETKRNIEVMWLMEKLTPDDRTICNFRKDNAKALKKVFREYSLWCDSQGLYGKELEAVDGSKFRANASRKSIHTQKGTSKKLIDIENKIEKYMKEMDENDASETDETKLSTETISEILKNLNEKKDILNDWLKQIEENDGKEISTVDTDARLMHTNGDGRPLDACYNVQTIVDEKHKLIVDFDVTICPDDKGALVNMTESAKEIMGVSEISAIGDKGYYDGEDIEKCEENGTTCYVPKTATHAPAPDSAYNRERFKYDKEAGGYICPEGKLLSFMREHRRGKESVTDHIYENAKACKNCANREKCTTSKTGGRKIYRNPYQDSLDNVDARMKTGDARKIFSERKKIVEHPFGTIKYVWGFRQYLCRGQEMTTAEQSLAFLAYNFKRVFNIFRRNGKDLREVMA
jgi:transposase